METSYAKIGKIPIPYPPLLVGELAHPIRINQESPVTTSVSFPNTPPPATHSPLTDRMRATNRELH